MQLKAKCTSKQLVAHQPLSMQQVVQVVRVHFLARPENLNHLPDHTMLERERMENVACLQSLRYMASLFMQVKLAQCTVFCFSKNGLWNGILIQ